MNFLKERKNQDLAHVLRFRTDGGGEYVNAEPQESFASEGIYTELHTPIPMGLVEWVSSLTEQS